MTLRRPYPFFNVFRDYVQKELTYRKTTYPQSVTSPFVRVTSCQTDPSVQRKYAFFTLGLHGFEQRDLNIFDTTYAGRDIVGYAVDLKAPPTNGLYQKRLISSDELTEGALPPEVRRKLTAEQQRYDATVKQKIQEQDLQTFALGSQPIPGVTSVRVTRSGPGIPFRAEVDWQCYNRAQLEFLRHHFLTAGRFVVVEWGQTFHDRRLNKILDFANVEQVKRDLASAVLKGRTHIINSWNESNAGNYDFIIGMVGNFRVSLDAQHNVYTCTSVIYSASENLYGIDNHRTKVRIGADEETRICSSFVDFFKWGGGFDRLVQENVAHTQYVAGTHASWAKSNENKAVFADELKNVSTNPNDYRFISWEFFTTVIVPAMMDLLKGNSGRVELLKFIDFFKTSDPDVTDKDYEDWVGDNPMLKSTDPSVMLIVRSSMSANTTTGLLGVGYFDQAEGSYGHRGKLSRGVWLNTGMIRAAFLQQQKFFYALKQILDQMNRATENFWALRLFYDDEVNKYKIIDAKCGEKRQWQANEFYRFNEAGIGEVLNLDFDSAFPPELITQMALYAQIKSSPAPRRDDLMEKYPMIGTTSPFIFTLNWTNLEDVVSQAIDVQLSNEAGLPATPAVPLKAVAPSGQQNLRGTFRLTGGDPNVIGPVSFTSARGGQPGAPNSATKVENPLALPPEANAITDRANITEDNILIPAFPTGNEPQAGSIAFRHNNPGNLVYAGQAHASKGDLKDNFSTWARFDTKEHGFEAVIKQVERRQAQSMTVWTFVTDPTHGYAPASDGNRVDQYVGSICRELNCTKDTPLVQLDSVALATVIVKLESSTVIVGYKPKKNDNPDYKPAATGSAVVYAPTPEEIQQVQDTEKRVQSTFYRFGPQFLTGLVEFAPSTMVNRITTQGFRSFPTPNNFVAPFPTTTAVLLRIRGIAGISVTDGFIVDRLPFIFERYGVFQVLEVNEDISPTGWVTSVRGYFKLLFLNGDGGLGIPKK